MRSATPEDVPALVDLMSEFYAESETPMDRRNAASSFARLLGEPSLGAVWLIEAEGRTVGYAVLCLGFSLEYGGLDAFVDDLFVQTSFRRRGLARAALSALFEECRRRGVRALHLEVGADNAAARRLYAAFGFREGGRQLWSARLQPEPGGSV